MADKGLRLGTIRGKVAQVLNDTDVVLNIGFQAGVAEDMVFAILNAKGSSVRDPDTHLELGSISIPKVLVKISLVDTRLSVASTYRSSGGLGLYSSTRLPNLFLRGKETLRQSEHPEVAELDEKDSVVKIGDPVVQVLNPPND